jgi:Protein of unknown function (DUF4230)
MSNSNRSSFRSIAIIAMAVAAGLFAFGALGSLLDLHLPFGTETTDHSPPVIVNEIRDLAEFRAAEADLEVIVDQERDVKWVPSFLAGERVQYVAVGTVEATVDFSSLSDGAVIVDDDRKATIIVPAPQIGAPVIDFDRGGVMNRDRGVLNRLGGVFVDNPTSEEALIAEAEEKMVAAAASSDLLERAEENTTAMLTDLATALGVEEVRVVFEQPRQP